LCAIAGRVFFDGPAEAVGADMTPINLTGFNRDVVIENTASGPPYVGVAVELNPGENLTFYQSGLPGKAYGLPLNGDFVSAIGDNTTFQLQPYTGNNALVFSSATGLTEGTLVVTTPQTFSRIAIIANSASGGGPADLTINFTDNTTFVTSYIAYDWFNNSDFALQGFERINLTTGNTSGATANPRLYQTTIDLVALLGVGNKPIASIIFGKVPSAGATAVYGVSGEVAPPTPASILVYPTNTTVVETTSATFTAAAGGTPVPKLQWLRNSAPVAGATNSTYTFIAALADHNATYRLVASNFVNSISYVVTSTPAMLTVTADTNAPGFIGRAVTRIDPGVGTFLRTRQSPAPPRMLANYSLEWWHCQFPSRSARRFAKQRRAHGGHDDSQRALHAHRQ
jgi:hypothetical protein